MSQHSGSWPRSVFAVQFSICAYLNTAGWTVTCRLWAVIWRTQKGPRTGLLLGLWQKVCATEQLLMLTMTWSLHTSTGSHHKSKINWFLFRASSKLLLQRRFFMRCTLISLRVNLSYSICLAFCRAILKLTRTKILTSVHSEWLYYRGSNFNLCLNWEFNP